MQIYVTPSGHTLCKMKCLNSMLQLQLPEEPLGWESAFCGNCGDRGLQRAVKWPSDIASWGLSTFLCQSQGGIPAYPSKLPCSTTISSWKPIHLAKLLMQLLKLLLFRDSSIEMYSPLGFGFKLLAPLLSKVTPPFNRPTSLAKCYWYHGSTSKEVTWAVFGWNLSICS